MLDPQKESFIIIKTVQMVGNMGTGTAKSPLYNFLTFLFDFFKILPAGTQLLKLLVYFFFNELVLKIWACIIIR